jgi:hypothetical protein
VREVIVKKNMGATANAEIAPMFFRVIAAYKRRPLRRFSAALFLQDD